MGPRTLKSPFFGLKNGIFRICCFGALWRVGGVAIFVTQLLITRTFFCLENYLDSKTRNATHKFNPALHKYSWGILFKVRHCVWQQGSRGISYTFLVTRQNYRGESISVKMGRKTPDNYTLIQGALIRGRT